MWTVAPHLVEGMERVGTRCGKLVFFAEARLTGENGVTNPRRWVSTPRVRSMAIAWTKDCRMVVLGLTGQE